MSSTSTGCDGATGAASVRGRDFSTRQSGCWPVFRSFRNTTTATPLIVPADYVPQITHNLWITGAQWCDFLSFDDRFPLPLQTFLVRVPRDEKVIAAYAEKALTFLAEVDAEIAAVSAWEVAVA